MFGFMQPSIRVGLVDNGAFGLRLEGDYDIDCSESQICYTPWDDSCYAEVSGIKIGRDFHWQRDMVLRFKGRMMLQKRDDGSSSLINILPVEEYLRSVISSEMNPNAHPEFLKAHAIISRSWLLRMISTPRCRSSVDAESCGHVKIKEKSDNETLIRHISWTDVEAHKHYDVCCDDHCQRYQGITHINQEASDAVAQTHGLVMVDEDGQVADARFYKCCGGTTERFSSAWQDKDFHYLQSVVDPYCDPSQMTEQERQKILTTILKDYDAETTDFFTWIAKVTASQVAERLKSKFNLSVGGVVDIKPLKIGDSGRIVELIVEGADSSVVIGKELAIRKLLSDSHLYSSAFTIDRQLVEKEIVFTLKGKGWGHGVGLCQIGAAIMAERGYSCEQILRHYYPGIKLEKRY